MTSFNELIRSDKPVLIDFSAEWCGPCKMMKPILAELKSRMRDSVRILKIDVDKNPELARQHQIQGVPTLMVFKKGVSVWRKSGVVQATELQRILES